MQTPTTPETPTPDVPPSTSLPPDSDPQPYSSFASLDPEKIPWLWPHRFPLGQISLLVSQPGVGKSLLTIDIASRISTGAPWPDQQSPSVAGELACSEHSRTACSEHSRTACPEHSRGAPRIPQSDLNLLAADPGPRSIPQTPPPHQGSVLLIPREDDPNQVIRPRLAAHGANLHKVHILDSALGAAKMTPWPELFFNLRQYKPLEDALRALPDCRLVVLDPIAAFFQGSDLRHDGQVRTLLAPLFYLAQRYGPAILLLHHLQKRPSRSADQSILGGSSFPAISRNVWHLFPDPDDDCRRHLAPGKSNLSRRAPALSFTIGTDPATDAARVNWELNPHPWNADHALTKITAARSGPEPLSRLAAQTFLVELLKTGPMPVNEIETEARNAGVPQRTLQRAADYLAVIRKRLTDHWTWELPT